MKKQGKLLYFLLFFLLLSGCTTDVIETDTYREKKRELENIFGSYSLTDTSDIKANPSRFPGAFVSGKQWQIEYTHNTLGKRNFMLTNVHSFERCIEDEVYSILQYDISNTYLRPYFARTLINIPSFQISMINANSNTPVSISNLDLDYQKLGMGIINAQYLADNYDIQYDIKFVDIMDEWHLETLQSSVTKALLGFTPDTPHFTFSTKGNSDYFSSSCQYDSATDTYHWLNVGIERDKASVVDGIQMDMGRYSIDGHPVYLEDKMRIRWSEEEQQYLCSSEILFKVLALTPIRVRYDYYYWEIDGTHFTYHTETGLFTANGVTLEGSFTEDGRTDTLLTTSLMEMLTNSSVTYDSTNYMLTINS